MTKYNDKLDQIRRYAESQGIPLDSPRVRKYAVAQGLDPNDIGVEITESATTGPSELAVRKYADRMGLSAADPVVRKYANAGVDEEPALIDIQGSDDMRFKEAVLHYAESQSLELNDRRVQKYARGLLTPRGDFNEERRTSPVDPETAERRFNEAIQRYAERCGVSVDSPQVQKYADGLKKTGLVTMNHNGNHDART